jgi:hypothetical protein
MLKNFEDFKKVNESSINESVDYDKYPYYTEDNVAQYPEYLKEFDTLIKKLDITLGSLWSPISDISLIDVIRSNEDYNELGRNLQSIMKRFSDMYRKVSNSIHNVMEKEDYESNYSNPPIDIILEDMYSYINDKSNLLDDLYELYNDIKTSTMEHLENQNDLMSKSDIFDSNNTASIIEIGSPDTEV